MPLLHAHREQILVVARNLQLLNLQHDPWSLHAAEVNVDVLELPCLSAAKIAPTAANEHDVVRIRHLIDVGQRVVARLTAQQRALTLRADVFLELSPDGLAPRLGALLVTSTG